MNRNKIEYLLQDAFYRAYGLPAPGGIEKMADAILEHHAVVELHECTGREKSTDEYPGLSEWDTDLARVVVFDDGQMNLDIDRSVRANVTPTDARALAAVLLAAARTAEENL